MLELPRACLISDKFAPMVKFMSFGTNDLTQSTYVSQPPHPHPPTHPDVARHYLAMTSELLAACGAGTASPETT